LDKRVAHYFVGGAGDYNAICMTLLDGILEDNGLVVYQLYSILIDLHLIQPNEAFYAAI